MGLQETSDIKDRTVQGSPFSRTETPPLHSPLSPDSGNDQSRTLRSPAFLTIFRKMASQMPLHRQQVAIHLFVYCCPPEQGLTPANQWPTTHQAASVPQPTSMLLHIRSFTVAMVSLQCHCHVVGSITLREEISVQLPLKESNPLDEPSHCFGFHRLNRNEGRSKGSEGSFLA